ncbi:hypothetical protein KP509_04G022300 [Ceratopteris richardii]|nr:hypothetical protein KP509_04G022300 [Ceratopteris richardii]
MRPLRRMLQELEKSLRKALVLAQKCNHKGMMRRVITITSAHDFKRVNGLLENSLGDLSWFISMSGTGEKSGFVGMPNISTTDALLGYCWLQIGNLYRGSEEERNEAVSNLYSYAKEENEKIMKLMVEEEAIPPLLKILQDGSLEAREMTAHLLGRMARDEIVVKEMVACGMIPIAVKSLHIYGAPMKIQAAVAWAIAEMLESDPSQQDFFLEEKVVQSLVGLLGESLEDLEKARPPMDMHTLMTSVAAKKAAVAASKEDHIRSIVPKPSESSNGHFKADTHVKPQASLGQGFLNSEANRNIPGKSSDVGKGLSQRELNRRERENASPQLKEELKAAVARALWKLARGNPKACINITETKALLCLATLMEKTTGVLQRNSVMVVMEIASVAEIHIEVRRKAFKMSSPAVKAVVDQLLRLMDKGDPELQVACVKAIGCLSRTFPVSETRLIKLLVKKLEESASDDAIAEEVVAALEKFVCKDNYLHKEHSKAVVEASGVGPLVQIVFLEKGAVQVNAVKALCNIALHSGENEELSKAQPLPALKNFAKTYNFSQQPSLEELVHQAINHLEIYHGRGDRHLPGDSYEFEL